MIKAKKSLGQNFLVDRNIIDKISNFKDIQNKTILEIGPGTGNLTSSLLQKKPKKFYVIEKDNSLVTILRKEFNDQIIIINDDVLSVDENIMLALYWLIARLVFAVIYVSGFGLDNKSEESQGPDRQPLRSFVWAGSIVILIAMTLNLS